MWDLEKLWICQRGVCKSIAISFLYIPESLSTSLCHRRIWKIPRYKARPFSMPISQHSFVEALQLHRHIYLVDAVFVHHIRLPKSDLLIDVLRVIVSKGIGGGNDLGMVLLLEQCQQFPQSPLTVMLILIGAVDGEVPEEEAVSLKGAEHGKADARIPIQDVV